MISVILKEYFMQHCVQCGNLVLGIVMAGVMLTTNWWIHGEILASYGGHTRGSESRLFCKMLNKWIYISIFMPAKTGTHGVQLTFT